MIDFSDSHEKAQKGQKKAKKAPFLAALFSIEIRTISPIISLKCAEFLALAGIVVLGSVLPIAVGQAIVKMVR